ncbi:hypothetical protein ACF073_07130 [Streptomyces sp. NPDC015171]|uniref:hypothetical protein n=1 Tax=Streptomyces sp. NPDC015171 TaxID=3364945 RepID=UPI0036FD2FCD
MDPNIPEPANPPNFPDFSDVSPARTLSDIPDASALAGATVLRVFTGAPDRPADDPLGPLRAALLTAVTAVAAAGGLLDAGQEW